MDYYIANAKKRTRTTSDKRFYKVFLSEKMYNLIFPKQAMNSAKP